MRRHSKKYHHLLEVYRASTGGQRVKSLVISWRLGLMQTTERASRLAKIHYSIVPTSIIQTPWTLTHKVDNPWTRQTISSVRRQKQGGGARHGRRANL